MNELIAAIEKEYKLKVAKKPNADFALDIIFDDGRHYVFQEPPFFETYEALTKNNHTQRNLFELAVKHLYPANDKSPKIDEEYLRKNKQEAIFLWGRLLPECFFFE